MNFNFWDFIYGNIKAAGFIGAYVSFSIIGLALISFSTRNKLKKDTQIGSKKIHPLIGALLGIIPGCGATIIVSSMYKNRKISFGGLLATFIATLGEGSFVLLGASEEADVAANFKGFLIINITGFVIGTISGFLADLLGIKKDREETDPKETPKIEGAGANAFVKFTVEKLGFFIILAIGLFLLPGSVMAFWGGSIAAIEGISIMAASILTIVCIIYILIYHFGYKGSCACDHNSMKSTLTHAVADVALVVFYVLIGLTVANFIIDILVGPERFNVWMNSSRAVIVLIAALIGVTPGCGGMITVAVAYTMIPNFPMAALIAAGIATSGDGIFPLLAKTKKDGVLVTVIGFVVSVVVGYLALIFT